MPMSVHCPCAPPGQEAAGAWLGALRMQPGLISTQLQLGIRGGTAGVSTNLRGAEQAPALPVQAS